MSYWIWVGLTSMTSILKRGKVGYRKKQRRHTKGKVHVKGRNWSDAATSQGMPSTASNHRKLGEDKNSSLESSEGAWPSHQHT